MTPLDSILELLKQLSKSDLEKLKENILGQDKSDVDDLEMYIQDNRFSGGRVCPHCGSVHIARNGHEKNGKQRYICHDCKKSFTITSNSIVHRTRKELEVWEKYAECMINRFSIRKTAAAFAGIENNFLLK